MAVAVRPLTTQDIDQVKEIDREAFSTAWSQVSFRRELENQRAAYLVAWEPVDEQLPEAVPKEYSDTAGATTNGPLPTRFVSTLRKFVSQGKRIPSGTDRVLGYVGMWFMGPEAHITAIAVRSKYRGQGVGELLLMGSIETALKRGSEVVTLEARVSNYVARSLYEKYGFMDVGFRKGYYTDNREDAVIMTTKPIYTPQYRARFQRLQEAYVQRHGSIHLSLA